MYEITGGLGAGGWAKSKPPFAFGILQPLRQGQAARAAADLVARNWDVMPDGQRLLGVIVAGQVERNETGAGTPQQIRVVVNWFEEVRQRAGAR